MRSKTQSFSHSSVSSAGNYKHTLIVVAKHDAERLVVAFYGARSGLISATSTLVVLCALVFARVWMVGAPAGNPVNILKT